MTTRYSFNEFFSCLQCLLLSLIIISIFSINISAQGAKADNKIETRTVSFETNEGTALTFDISPDGETIVFDLLGQLWTLPAGGGDATQLTDAVKDTAEDLNPRFSPDGEWIVFSGNRGGKAGVWMISDEGDDLRKLSGTETAARTSRPSWSHDGNTIVFSGSGGIYLHDVKRDTTTRLELPDEAGNARYIDWMPDDRLLVHLPEWEWTDPLGGSLSVIDPQTGTVDTLENRGMRVTAPAPSSDGRFAAYFVQEEGNLYQHQLWIHHLEENEAVQLTRQDGISSAGVRWMPGDEQVLYSAQGRLWRMPVNGGEPQEIPCTARVEFEREEQELPQINFPEPGTKLTARGHRGLAISPDAKMIGIIALGKLWIWTIGEEPEAVAELPANASRLTWSPDGNEVAYVAGPGGDEDLFAFNLKSGKTRRLTSLPGRVDRPVWSPDGEHIAFVYWSAPGYPGAIEQEPRRFAVISAGDNVVDDPSELRIIADLPSGWWRWLHPLGEEIPTWSPESDAVFKNSFTPKVISLEGEPISIEGFSNRAAFVHWAADSSLIYTKGNQLWRATLKDTTKKETKQLSDDVAIYPSIAHDGTILYVSTDGYRLLYPDGSKKKLGFPLTYTIPYQTSFVLIRDVRIIDGTGAAPDSLSDVLVENGRIKQIKSAGVIEHDDDTEIIKADGRTLIPGLIDLHVHGLDGVYTANFYYGITTVREMGMPIADVAAFRDAAAAGIHPGPRIVLGGYQINVGFPSLTTSNYQYPRGEKEISRTLQLLETFGADFVKMRTFSSPAEAATLIRKANSKGMRIGGHCAYPLPLIAAGIDNFDHLDDCRESMYLMHRNDLLHLYHEAGVDVVPTILWTSMRAYIAEEPSILLDTDINFFINPEHRRYYGRRSNEGYNAYLAWWRESLKSLIPEVKNKGIKIGAGTDVSYFPGALHIELEELVDAGFSPMEAIVSATGNAAKILGADEEIGTIEEGKWADLIILNADPLEDIRNTREIWKVIKGGEIVDREGILEWAKKMQDINQIGEQEE